VYTFIRKALEESFIIEWGVGIIRIIKSCIIYLECRSLKNKTRSNLNRIVDSLRNKRIKKINDK